MEATFHEAAESVARTIRQSFAFSGRSRRLDILYYWIASMLITTASGETVRAVLNWNSAFVAEHSIQLVVLVPYFALFARRLHDFGRSGCWTLCLPPTVAASLYDNVRVVFHAFDPGWPQLGWWNLMLVFPVLLSLAVMLIPGDVDENRYGPDPRLAQQEAHRV